MIQTRVAIAASSIILLAGCGSDRKSPVGPDRQCDQGSLTIGAVRTGTVSATDCGFPAASSAVGNYDAYSVTLTAGQVYQVKHRATVTFDWDPYLEVLGPAGNVLAVSDDDFSTWDSELFFIAPSAGTYSVRAGGLDAGELGDYRLSIHDCGATPITTTAPVSGALTAADCRTTFAPTTDSSLADVFLFTATASERTLTVTSSTFSPAFIVAGPAFAFESRFADASSLGPPAVMTIGDTLAAGTYLVIVSAESGVTGDGAYTIQSSVVRASTRVEARPPAPAAWRVPTLAARRAFAGQK